MAKRVRVATRALKRGRGLRSSAARVERHRPAIDDAATDEEPMVETVPEGRGSQEALEDDDDVAEESSRRSGYSRPPAPSFDLSANASLDELAAMSSDAEDSAFEAEVDDPLLSTTLESRREPALLEAAPSSDERQLQVYVEEPEPESVGETFFSEPDPRDEQGSLMPVVDELATDESFDEPAPESITPEQRQRRTRLRRVVGFAVAAVAVLTVGLATKAAVTSAPSYAQRHAATAAAALAEEAPATLKASQQSDEAAAPPAQAEAPAEDTAADDAAASGDYETVRNETLQLLNQRKFDDAIVAARKLIAIEPTTAFGYRCLGSAYQDLGKIKEARQAYSECVRVAKKGEVAECSALGGTAK